MSDTPANRREQADQGDATGARTVAGRVLVTASLPDPGISVLEAAGLAVDQYAGPGQMPRAALIERIATADAVLCTLSDRIDAAVLDAAPSLQIVANYAVGYDNLDVAEITGRGVIATNTPDVLTDATADLTWTLLLAAARGLRLGDEQVRSGAWGQVPPVPLGLAVSGQTLGIVGLGRIGAAVAARAAGFGMRVLYSGARPSRHADRVNAVRVDLDELLAQSDFVSLHAPLTTETRHLIDGPALAAMKSTAILINAGRGSLVDEEALVAALRDHVIAGAGLDVFEHEPAIAEGLADLDNVVFTPHIGSATTQTRGAMVRLCSENIIAVLAGEPPSTPIV